MTSTHSNHRDQRRDNRQALITGYGSLEPISAPEAIELYIEDRTDELTPSTLDDYENSLNHFVQYCKSEKIDNLNNLNGRDIVGFAQWRKNDSSEKVDQLAKKTMRDEMYLLGNFLSFCERIDAVERGTSNKVNPPTLKPGEGVRDVELDIKYLKEVTSYLRKYNYATCEHVSIKIIEETGRRLGCVHSLDLCDAYVDQDKPYLDFRHHEDYNTSLKNGKKSEQEVSISQDLAALIQDYISHQRIDKEIDGREPLLTTPKGRLAKSTIRTYFYKWTRPCKIGKSCPQNRDPEDCEATISKDHASKCPNSEAPHAAKHGYITEMSRQGVPNQVLSERCDVSEEIIKEVYDERTTSEKRELRREILQESLNQEDNQ